MTRWTVPTWMSTLVGNRAVRISARVAWYCALAAAVAWLHPAGAPPVAPYVYGGF